VVDKPGGLLSVPGRGPDKSDCVVNRLKYMIPGCMEQPSVHRLDMDTSGLLVLALRPDAHRNLSRQFQEREVEKRYIALLDGSVTGNGGEIQLSFRLDVDNRPYQVYDPVHGKLGVTLWSKIAEDDHTTRIAFTPITGRTHQLRVHAAHPLGLDCPIIGDRLYGNGIPGDSLLLHAHFLRFRHPVSGVIMNFESNVPF
ncbi:MAG: RluA family pseudouridine synthase, partial [Desulfobulbaceae bacterium]|nr:RluA family pseudouridine synthase [Desulfobulbaceae bacterium]